jgi:pyruvate,water dikinase
LKIESCKQLLTRTFELIKQRFKADQPEQEGSSDAELKELFQQRYADFRALLKANTQALDVMQELERALRGEHPFGMAFIRSRNTALLTAVYKIIRHLNRLAPNTYPQLMEVYDDIEEEISEILENKKLPDLGDKFVVSLKEILALHTDHVGSKMANLGELRQALKLNIPQGFVITTAGHKAFFEHNNLQVDINELLQTAKYKFDSHSLSEEEEKASFWSELTSKIQSMIKAAAIPDNLLQALQQSFIDHFGQDGQIRIAVRSSALGEDLANISFAGQYLSVLNVDLNNLPQAYKDVLASKYALQAMNYRYYRGIKDESVLMAVGCMEMINAAQSGVMYTQSPTDSEDNGLIITAVHGLAKGVVNGTQSADNFVLERDKDFTLRSREIGHKAHKLVPDPESGVHALPLEEREQDQACLSREQLIQLAREGLKIEDHFGTAQDIEWAFGPDGQLIFLQTRALSRRQGPQEHLQLSVQPLITGGLTASPGSGFGEVFHVENDTDLNSFPDNAILVSSKSLPKWAAVLARASGVITEHGSVAGHLANIAREFGVPAILGLKEATSLLTNGQIISLDADERRIFEGKVEELLQDQPAKPCPIAGTPIYNLLDELSRYILPLYLVDPDSSEFRAANCKTLHDITRFAHEKSVQEMFQFGVKHQFSPRSGKQLKTSVPMQWWVLNLDDGLKEDQNGRYVHLDEVQSLPMLALWRGITAIPWQGPPGMDHKGLASVFYQATINPELNETAASNFKVKNYFMISREFCNLFSRFGFHFSSVEALVGQRIRENYIRFQFKGGAADYFRRERRAQFISQILEEYGFQIRLREDSLEARMDNYEAEHLLQQLKILGHLIIHTRQLDMIMQNYNLAESYRERLVKELEEVKMLSLDERY